MYKDKMLSYYPLAVKSILEFQAIIDGEHPEFETLESSLYNVVNDAYLLTMSEGRVAQWESKLGIRPEKNATLSDRRDVVISSIRGQGKLNTETINKIVSSFTGNTADSKLIDGVLHIEVKRPIDNRSYNFANLKQVLLKKVPAHLGVQITLGAVYWNEVKTTHPTWEDVQVLHETWEDVCHGKHLEVGALDITPIEDFILV